MAQLVQYSTFPLQVLRRSVVCIYWNVISHYWNRIGQFTVGLVTCIRILFAKNCLRENTPERTRDVVLIFERPANERPSGPWF